MRGHMNQPVEFLIGNGALMTKHVLSNKIKDQERIYVSLEVDQNWTMHFMEIVPQKYSYYVNDETEIRIGRTNKPDYPEVSYWRSHHQGWWPRQPVLWLRDELMILRIEKPLCPFKLRLEYSAEGALASGQAIQFKPTWKTIKWPLERVSDLEPSLP